MSFFKDFKADFSQAMNELMPDSNEMYDEDEVLEELNTPKKDKTAAKAEKQAERQAKRAAKAKKNEEKEEKENRKVKATRPPKELPIKQKIEEAPSGEDLGIAPEDMSDQIDELLDAELYSDERDPASLLQDDTEVNTMDMSVEEMLSQLAEKHEEEAKGEQMTVDDLLNQLGKPPQLHQSDPADRAGFQYAAVHGGGSRARI